MVVLPKDTQYGVYRMLTLFFCCYSQNSGTISLDFYFNGSFVVTDNGAIILKYEWLREIAV